MGFVPNMRVPCTFYVNELLQKLMFEELEQFVQRGEVGGFLPAVKQLANVAALPGKFPSPPLRRAALINALELAASRASDRHREGVHRAAGRAQRLRLRNRQRCSLRYGRPRLYRLTWCAPSLIFVPNEVRERCVFLASGSKKRRVSALLAPLGLPFHNHSRITKAV